MKIVLRKYYLKIRKRLEKRWFSENENAEYAVIRYAPGASNKYLIGLMANTAPNVRHKQQTKQTFYGKKVKLCLENMRVWRNWQTRRI
jgi:hypothetical protein